jgi:hypothetical protein
MKKEEGQATVEFALVMLLMLGFILFYIQLSFIFAFGNFTHYATFMSARAFLSAGPDIQDQMERAQAVIKRTVKTGSGDRFPSIAKGSGGGDPEGFETISTRGDRDSSWMNGVRYTFKSRLFLLPMGKDGGAKGGKKSVNEVTLTSESWLGREPTHDECKTEMGKYPGYWDNGC